MQDLCAGFKGTAQGQEDYLVRQLLRGDSQTRRSLEQAINDMVPVSLHLRCAYATLFSYLGSPRLDINQRALPALSCF